MKRKYYLLISLFLVFVIVYFSSINIQNGKETFISHTTINKHKRNLRIASTPYLKLVKKYAPFHFGLLDDV
jgi:uncharacterized protein (UPF0333 family)